MTNPNDAVGTNAAFDGRTSVKAFNDIAGCFSSAGILSGWECAPDSGMYVVLGGNGTTRDVALAENNTGDKTTINNRSGQPIQLEIAAAPATDSRIDAIVAYVTTPPTGTSTVADNPATVGLIDVVGVEDPSPVAPDDNAIRTAISADGGSGATAYYVILAYVTVANGTTDITNNMITAGASATLNSAQIADNSITSDKVDWTTIVTSLWTGDSHGASIILSDDPTNYKYLIFVYNSSSNGTTTNTCKIPTGIGIRYTVSSPFMFENGGIAIDCVQYTASGTTLSVKYQGFVGIGNNGNTTVSQTTGIHVLKIFGTNID